MKKERDKSLAQVEVLCFGEVLWDLFAERSLPGGAPMNVGYHLSHSGITTGMVSKVGDDDLGATLLQQLEKWNIDTSYCSIDLQYPTGTVVATLDENNEAHYEIKEEVAWDYIQVAHAKVVFPLSCKAFVYGSLAARSEVSKQTLLSLLPYAPYKVFDVNLRPPFYNHSLLQELLQAADMVKMSEAELQLIIQLEGRQFATEEEGVAYIQQRFSIKELVLTKGSRGARYYEGGLFYELPVVPITVKDTVGSGDSFLAGFLSEKIKNASPQEALLHAIALSAFVTAKEGACPEYSKTEFMLFKEEALAMLKSKWKSGNMKL